MFIPPGAHGIQELETKVLVLPPGIEALIAQSGAERKGLDTITEQLWYPTPHMLAAGISMRLRHVVDEHGNATVEWVVKDKHPPIQLPGQEAATLKYRKEYELEDQDSTATNECRFSTILKMLELLGYQTRDRIVSERVTYGSERVKYELRRITEYHTSAGPLPEQYLPKRFLEFETKVTDEHHMELAVAALVEAAGAVGIDPSQFDARDKRRVIQDHLAASRFSLVTRRRTMVETDRKKAKKSAPYLDLGKEMDLLKLHLDASKNNVPPAVPKPKS